MVECTLSCISRFHLRSVMDIKFLAYWHGGRWGIALGQRMYFSFSSMQLRAFRGATYFQKRDRISKIAAQGVGFVNRLYDQTKKCIKHLPTSYFVMMVRYGLL